MQVCLALSFFMPPSCPPSIPQSWSDQVHANKSLTTNYVLQIIVERSILTTIILDSPILLATKTLSIVHCQHFPDFPGNWFSWLQINWIPSTFFYYEFLVLALADSHCPSYFLGLVRCSIAAQTFYNLIYYSYPASVPRILCPFHLW